MTMDRKPSIRSPNERAVKRNKARRRNTIESYLRGMGVLPRIGVDNGFGDSWPMEGDIVFDIPRMAWFQWNDDGWSKIRHGKMMLDESKNRHFILRDGKMAPIATGKAADDDPLTLDEVRDK